MSERDWALEDVGKRWEIIDGKQAYTGSSVPGGDVERGWRYILARDADERKVNVEVSNTLSAAGVGDRPDDVERAMSTKGRSAVEKVLDEDELPERLIITTTGVYPS